MATALVPSTTPRTTTKQEWPLPVHYFRTVRPGLHQRLPSGYQVGSSTTTAKFTQQLKQTLATPSSFATSLSHYVATILPFVAQQLQTLASCAASVNYSAYNDSQQLQLVYGYAWETYHWSRDYYNKMAASAFTTEAVSVEEKPTITPATTSLELKAPDVQPLKDATAVLDYFISLTSCRLAWGLDYRAAGCAQDLQLPDIANYTLRLRERGECTGVGNALAASEICFWQLSEANDHSTVVAIPFSGTCGSTTSSWFCLASSEVQPRLANQK